MAQNMSLADQVIEALAAVSQMDHGMDNDQPERHEVRNLKRIAEQAIADAMRTAVELSWQAKAVRKLAREIEATDKPHNEQGNAPRDGA